MSAVDAGAGDLLERSTRVVLRPIANPLPLGFLALAGGTFVLAALQLGWIATDETPIVALVLLLFVAPLQLVASVLGFLARDVVAGTGMGVLTGTWLTVGAVMFRSPPGSTSDTVGFLLLASAVAMLVPGLTALAGKLVPAAVLLTAATRFAITGGYQLAGSDGWKDAAGVVGVALAVLAVYAAFAMALEDARRTTVLPLLRRGSGQESISGTFRDQVARLEHEGGVREQL